MTRRRTAGEQRRAGAGEQGRIGAGVLRRAPGRGEEAWRRPDASGLGFGVLDWRFEH